MTFAPQLPLSPSPALELGRTYRTDRLWILVMSLSARTIKHAFAEKSHSHHEPR